MKTGFHWKDCRIRNNYLSLINKNGDFLYRKLLLWWRLRLKVSRFVVHAFPRNSGLDDFEQM